jgi:hypothetical protein
MHEPTNPHTQPVSIMPTTNRKPHTMHTQLDHIVIGATTLAQGVAWCEATLGVVPGPGGEHLNMGTHNRLLRISSDAFPNAYLEIIAIAPHLAAPTAHPRWFDLDNPAIVTSLNTHGPQLLHWVAQTDDIHAACAATEQLGITLGQPQAVSRMTQRGLLEWTFSINASGERPMHGALPHLIQWADASPVVHMPLGSVGLSSVSISAAPEDLPLLRSCAAALALEAVTVEQSPSAFNVQLLTPAGLVTLQTPAHGY